MLFSDFLMESMYPDVYEVFADLKSVDTMYLTIYAGDKIFTFPELLTTERS